MTTHASGSFDVRLEAAPLAPGTEKASLVLGRSTIDKRFHGDLDATSLGEMLSAGTSTKGSAGYVAIEVVQGVLGGRRGAFVLQHSGTMARGTPTLTVSVVPDSGTGDLAGLSGQMIIRIEGGKHFYEFEYAFPNQ
jgi:hypothetical protein